MNTDSAAGGQRVCRPADREALNMGRLERRIYEESTRAVEGALIPVYQPTQSRMTHAGMHKYPLPPRCYLQYDRKWAARPSPS